MASIKTKSIRFKGAMFAVRCHPVSGDVHVLNANGEVLYAGMFQHGAFDTEDTITEVLHNRITNALVSMLWDVI